MTGHDAFTIAGLKLTLEYQIQKCRDDLKNDQEHLDRLVEAHRQATELCAHIFEEVDGHE